MIVYFNLSAFIYLGEETYKLRDEKGRTSLLNKGDIVLLKDDFRAKYLEYKKNLFQKCEIHSTLKDVLSKDDKKENIEEEREEPQKDKEAMSEVISLQNEIEQEEQEEQEAEELKASEETPQNNTDLHLPLYPPTQRELLPLPKKTSKKPKN
ncbi:hypothetical protein B6S12_07640 [Helicobacter valdiviensis]|uniref:Uncharacterized protein n=1 Tax=Helicobacter valdiviensis TaxID=1458358 RepID=A0A2W6MT54_9HELI|nr:hypothetical protein [Helicobacter valdiviensis]PZT47725.1 hypothetical protein B6S12_07640 [Helicobacter valdiviensis]